MFDTTSMAGANTSSVGFGALALVVVVFTAMAGVPGAAGAMLVGGCWLVFGPVAAVAVGHLTLPVVGPQSIGLLVVMAAPLWILLFTAAGSVATPRRLFAGAGAVVTVTTVLTLVAWVWRASVAWACLVALLTIAGALYAVHRYERVTVSRTPD
jgi:hypothetical protein